MTLSGGDTVLGTVELHSDSPHSALSPSPEGEPCGFKALPQSGPSLPTGGLWRLPRGLWVGSSGVALTGPGSPRAPGCCDPRRHYTHRRRPPAPADRQTCGSPLSVPAAAPHHPPAIRRSPTQCAPPPLRRPTPPPAWLATCQTCHPRDFPQPPLRVTVENLCPDLEKCPWGHFKLLVFLFVF